jgi:hypothetical protein
MHLLSGPTCVVLTKIRTIRAVRDTKKILVRNFTLIDEGMQDVGFVGSNFPLSILKAKLKCAGTIHRAACDFPHCMVAQVSNKQQISEYLSRIYRQCYSPLSPCFHQIS